ncbi:MAG: winged helix-turn-helix transcriptional regulator [Acidimicrobiia bacterium]|nr:winged helix-turn-helix transcriptional regulator [Acidimicrobiia bacterium]
MRTVLAVDAHRLATIGSVLGSESRAAIVCALMSGTAHTGTELARHVGITPSTASEHLGVLVDAGLVIVEAQGRHRYFALASPATAEVLEQLMDLPVGLGGPAMPKLPAGMSFARSCYDHLAGEVAVQVFHRLVERGHLGTCDGTVTVTSAGHEWFDGLGIGHRPTSGRPAARSCLDWSQRRPHLGGVTGAALLDHMLQHRWFLRRGATRRALELTATGRHALVTHLDLEIP